MKQKDRKRLFVDMDGTVAKFTPVDTLEILYEPGYFLNLDPIPNTVKAIRLLQAQAADIEVFILSSYLSDSQYALKEKSEWLNKYLPETDFEHRIFCPCGTCKKEVVPGGIRATDHLLDDYTCNLAEWEPPAIGIKLLNGINHSKGSWKGSRISVENSPYLIVRKIVKVVGGDIVVDNKPQEMVANERVHQPDTLMATDMTYDL